MAKKVEEKQCSCWKEECKCTEKRTYKVPAFSYGEEVVVIVPDKELKVWESEDSDFTKACFYEWMYGTVLDVETYSWSEEDVEPCYSIRLDDVVEWDHDTKVIYIWEKYLGTVSYEDEREYSTVESIKNLAKEKLDNPDSDVGELLVAKVILDAFDKAEKFDSLNK